MTSSPEPPPDLYDHVVRAVIAYEHDGEAALARAIAEALDLAPAVQRQIETMQQSGLLQHPEQPERVGPYRVLQRLGSGGMGTVFLCDQLEPVRRRVAVKVMRAGMDSAEILARFRLEQRALAALAHPGIAALLDAGMTERGRPYLVMEYVAGVQLHRYCDERQLDGTARLELFARICDAVQHAHHKGIVHRDLKPSNVLVTDRDGAAWPIVIDFGVAKSVGGPTPGATALTLPGAMLGTPEYMSPEQATHELDVDTRADVYSLGVILYEMLTGTLPIDRERLRGSDVARVLGSIEPPTPSTRITTLGVAAAAIAGARRTDVAGLRRLLRGDLDWVVMKALEKDRNRRYGMPAELAADVRRFLASEPVSAGPVSAWYRLKKLCARNRAQAAAAGLVVTTVGLALVTSTWFWRDAVASSRASAANLDVALTAVGELVSVGDSDLVDVPHLAAVRRGLLERSVAFYRSFVEGADARDPRIAPRIVDAQLRLGCLQLHLGEYDRAMATLRDGTSRAGRLPAGAVGIPIRARGLDALASAAEHVADAEGAVAAASAAEQLLREDFARCADDEVRCWLLRVLTRRARQAAPKDRDAAHALAAEAIALAQPFVDGGDRHAARWPFVLDAGAELARRLIDLGRRDDALRELERAFALWQEARRRAVDPGVEWRLTTAVGQVASLFAQCDDYGRMLAVSGEAEAAHERLAADHPGVLEYRTGLAAARLRSSKVQMRNYRFVEGVASATRAEAEFGSALALAPADPTLLEDAALAATHLAHAHLESRRQGAPCDLDAARRAREAAAARIDALAQTPTGRRSASKLRLEERRLFALLHPTPDSPEVLTATGEAVRLADELVAAEPGDTALRERRIEMRIRHGQALRQRGDATGAHAVLAAALEDQTALRAAMASPELWSGRRAALLLELAHVEAALGDAGAVLERLRERVLLADNEDWGGKLEVVRMLLAFARGPLAADSPRLLARAREVVQLALQAGDAYVARGMPDGSPAMVAAMRANTWSLLVDVERLAGDVRAEADALGEVAGCRAEAQRLGGSDRSSAQLRGACDAWLQRLAATGDPAPLAAAAERIAAWSAADADALLAAAAHFARSCSARPDAAVQAAGRRLLDLAVAAGADRERLAQDAALQPLHGP